jgi:hypothetical protein
MKPMTQYLTAVFELRASKRNAAALDRVRSAAEGIVGFSHEEMRAGESKACPQFITVSSVAFCRAAPTIPIRLTGEMYEEENVDDRGRGQRPFLSNGTRQT